jgi:heme/copper-type cytochrome/quinol oxidase subunit 3
LPARRCRPGPGLIGTGLFLLSDVAMLAALLVSCAVVRSLSGRYHLPDAPLPDRRLALALTALLATASAAMILARRAARAHRTARVRGWLWLTAAAGTLFLCGQAHEYVGWWGPGLWARGLLPGSSAHATCFYLLTGFHGLHVLAGVLLLWPALAQRDLAAPTITALGLYWHFVDLVWLVVAALVYWV